MRRFWSLSMSAFFVVTLVVAAPRIAWADLVDRANEVFRVGDSRKMLVMVPKQGFVGSPSSSIDGRTAWRVPMEDKDWRTRGLRITVLDKYVLSDGLRVVLQINEPDPPGGFAKTREFTYFAYVDVTPERAEVHGCDRLLEAEEEIGAGGVLGYNSYIHGLPFPFLLTPILEATEKESSEECGRWITQSEFVAFEGTPRRRRSRSSPVQGGSALGGSSRGILDKRRPVCRRSCGAGREVNGRHCKRSEAICCVQMFCVNEIASLRSQ